MIGVARQRLMLHGGPKHDQIIEYGEPLPNTIVYQRKTESGWLCDNYYRIGQSHIYNWTGNQVAIIEECCGGGPQWGHAMNCPKCPD